MLLISSVLLLNPQLYAAHCIGITAHSPFFLVHSRCSLRIIFNSWRQLLLAPPPKKQCTLLAQHARSNYLF